MYRLEFADDGAALLDPSGRVVFSGTFEECEDFLDWQENAVPAPEPRPVTAPAPTFLRQLFARPAVALPQQPR